MKPTGHIAPQVAHSNGKPVTQWAVYVNGKKVGGLESAKWVARAALRTALAEARRSAKFHERMAKHGKG